MTLIAAGQNTRNRAMLGLQAMSQEEAEREALYQQMRQSQKAQNAQLAGTGLGIAGSYAAANPEVVKGAATSIGQSLGLLSTPAPKLAGDAVLSGGKLLINQSPALANAGSSVTSALASASNPATVGALASPVGTTGGVLGTSGTVAGGAAGATATTTGALATGGGTVGGAAIGGAATTAGAGAATGTAATGAATAGTGAAAGAAGSMAPLMAMAGPLAIGLGAFFLLNKLFD